MKFNCESVVMYIIGDNYVIKCNGKLYHFINNGVFNTSFNNAY